MSTAVHERLELYETVERFYIQALEGGPGGECLIIQRLQGAGAMSLGQANEIPVEATHSSIKGVLGIVSLGTGGDHLIVATSSQLLGTLNGHRLYSLTGTAVIPFSKSTLALSEAQVTANRALLGLLQSFLATPGFYFSYSLDLSHSLHRLHNTTPDFRATPMFERADQRFLWNKHALSSFYNHPDCHRFALPLIHGFLGVREVSLPNGKLKYVLISRRSVLRAGTRFWTRGLDNQGHAANFVETEQICEWGNRLTAHVQIRGSIPLFWSQRPNLKWQPTPLLDDNVPQSRGFGLHVTQLKAHYPASSNPIVLVNLINSKGREKAMATAFEGVVKAAQIPGVVYEYCDFHKACKEASWEEALEALRRRLSEYQGALDFFATTTDAEAGTPRTQAGIFRTNCMDSLDRTNVVQALIANTSLVAQLRWLGAIGPSQEISAHPNLVSLLKNIWADNADHCSVQYAGTGALKTDFTRYGTRTLQGKLRDGVNAITRYALNNFFDGAREDAIALFVGCWDTGKSSSVGEGLEEWKDWRGGVILALLFALAMLLLTILLATENTLSFLAFWGALVAACGAIVALNGHEFVNKAKLKQD